ncbi:hypothetical protein BJX96DRAFT_149930 [Aspergillus floccosus]
MTQTFVSLSDFERHNKCQDCSTEGRKQDPLGRLSQSVPMKDVLNLPLIAKENVFLRKRDLERENKNIQQPGFAGGHPPNY